MADMQKGATLPNPASQSDFYLLVDDALLLPGSITDRTEETAIATDDFIRIYDSSAAALRKAQIGNITSTLGSSFRTLTITNNSGTPNTQIDVAAEEVTVRGTGIVSKLLTSVSFTINAATVGANGIDSASLVASTWYYIFVIHNGTTTAGLLSLSRTAPALPSGYTFKAWVGAVWVRSTSVFRKFKQLNELVTLGDQTEAATAGADVNPFTSTEWTAKQLNVATWQTVDLARCVPPTVTKRASFIWGHSSSSGSGNNYTFLAATLATGGSAPASVIAAQYGGVIMNYVNRASALLGFYSAISFSLPVVTSQTVFLAILDTEAAANKSLRCTSFELNL
jgi:hypothetical protein